MPSPQSLNSLPQRQNEISAAGKYPLTVCPISGEALGKWVIRWSKSMMAAK